MKYNSTRNRSVSVSAAQAIAQGISADGGLFVPESLPQYSYEDLCKLKEMTYQGRAQRILSDFLTDFTQPEIEESVREAYSPNKFGGEHPAPLALQQNGDKNMYVLELWHGPTCAFKDMALQILPHLLTKSMSKVSGGKKAVILVATSGDTGKAALEGFRDVAGTEIMVFYPQDGVSPMQERQMNTQEGGNVHVCAIQGNFDDAQTGVKKIFTDPACGQKLAEHNMMFSSANSINWGRLLPQIVYYFSAYCDLMGTGEMDYEGEKVNIVVPTGNFGNILAAYYAMKMGLPVNKLICASNENNVLTDFIRTGVYNKNRPFHTTSSPSMDILVSSNLERLLYLVSQDASCVERLMRELNTQGWYQVSGWMLERLRAVFDCGCCDDAGAAEVIGRVWREHKYLCDPHTAVAWAVAEKHTREGVPMVVLSTASPYKFPAAVLHALGEASGDDEFAMMEQLHALTGMDIPKNLRGLEGRPVLHTDVIDKDAMLDYVLSDVLK